MTLQTVKDDDPINDDSTELIKDDVSTAVAAADSDQQQKPTVAAADVSTVNVTTSVTKTRRGRKPAPAAAEATSSKRDVSQSVFKILSEDSCDALTSSLESTSV